MIETRIDLKQWLPTTKKELQLRGWEQPDVILFTGDAYVDHPSFGAAVIGRILESFGLQVAIVAQPNWQDDLRDFTKLGRPRMFFGVTAGNMDSMVNHYTANKRLRSNDAYTPGGEPGKRPDYASVVYSKILKDKFPDVPILLGGIESSLRRFAHYDYWEDALRRPILADSGADMLVYGLGEKVIREIVTRLQAGDTFDQLRDIKQTAYMCAPAEAPAGMRLHSFEDCRAQKMCYADNFRHIETESNKHHAAVLLQDAGGRTLVVNPPYPHLETEDLDAVYRLPFTYLPHPKYAKRGDIPAYEMIKFSSNIHRGCFGGCSFCTISAHQGKFISSRSEDSVVTEIRKIQQLPDFKGYISDVGGPSANMYQMQGKDLSICEQCARPSCISPTICKNLDTDHTRLLQLYRRVRELPGIKKVTIGSGIRYDMLAADTAANRQYKSELVQHHVSGRLKVAPEHTEPEVLKLMRKPSFDLFREFKREFEQLNRKHGLNQQLIPYFISSHPGCSEQDMGKLSQSVKELGIRPEQVQDFTPTPMTLSTVIYYTGINPYTRQPIFTAKSKDEKLAQKDKFFWYEKDHKPKTAPQQSAKNSSYNKPKPGKRR